MREDISEQEAKKEFNLMGKILGSILGLLIMMWGWHSYFEAQAFNSITGDDVSAWEALWVDLEIEGSSR